MVAKEFECPRCLGTYYESSPIKKSMTCFSCPCKIKCMEISKSNRGGNTTLLSAAPSGPSVAKNNAEQEWSSMWQSMISTLSQDPNLHEVVAWIENFKRQHLGR